MSTLIKSNENIKSADILYKHEMYNSVVHCSYYSVFQLICHIINPIKKITGKDSHDSVLKQLTADIQSNHRCSFYEISTGIKKLKALRKESDYSEDLITPEKSKGSIEISITITGGLKKLYKIS